ncbi:MAG: 50S ribosomal protein L3 [Nanoarchaeota archaeon]|nr:50S ribosomal protein L3 [Nanoarchaeota archaeon]
MPKAHVPRRGSMQFWPRKRAKKATPRVRAWASVKDAKLLGFGGYKAGMSHVMLTDSREHSMTKGKQISCPVTIIECPALKVFSVKFYKNSNNGLKSVSQVFCEKYDKNLKKKMIIPKKFKKIDDIKTEDYDDLKVIVHTQPGLTGIGKKKPEIFEVGIGGDKESKLKFAKDMLGKDVNVMDFFNPGQQIDIHSITKGKGFQGPVKRFGVSIRSHKSEKTKRGPGSLGGWKGQAHFMYRIAHAGQMGYHLRTEYNKQILSIEEKNEKINPKGGFKHYSVIKNPCIIVKGSIAGSSKRFVRFSYATRPNKRLKEEKSAIRFA